MATTAHYLSVITNNSVKPPLNPHTGLSSTINERGSTSFSQSWHVQDEENDSDQENRVQMEAQMEGMLNMTNGTVHFNKTESMLQNMTGDLKDLSDNEFYSKLLELKNEHKKTLQMCEQLYHEKVGGSPGSGTGNRSGSELAFRESSPYFMMTSEKEINEDQSRYSQSRDKLTRLKTAKDNVRDLAGKPPVGRSPQPRLSAGRPSTAKARIETNRTSYSSDLEEYLSDGEHRSSRENILRKSDGSEANNSNVESMMSSLARIEDMWERFSVDDYAPRSRPRSSSLSRLSTSSKQKDDSWRHRVTIPKPFTMTEREEKLARSKSRTLEEYERQRLEKMSKEEEECQKKFKARPVPAHVYVPLFNEIMEKEEQKRKKNKEKSAELLKSTEKPFKFVKREEVKKKYNRSTSCPQDCLEKYDKGTKTTFKANPFPEHIFSDEIADKMEEEEEYRQIRIQMRSEELLRKSSLPTSMQRKGREYTEGRSRQKLFAEKAKKAGFTDEHKFRPRINGEVPNFEELHRQVLSEMASRKSAKEATVCKPFNLHTERIGSRRHKIYEDILNDEAMLRENRWPFQGSRSQPMSQSLSGSLSSSMDCIPAKMTASAQLRVSATKSRIQQQLEEELGQVEEERRRRLKEKQLRKSIAEKAAVNDLSKSLSQTTQQKLKEYRETEKARMKEYKKQLTEMEERLGHRPLLFERTAQENAKKAAEKKYEETLKKAGLDEEFIKKKGSKAGPSSGRDLDSDDEYSPHSHRSAHSIAASYSAASSRSQKSRRSQSQTYQYTEEFNSEDEASDVAED